MQEVGQLREHVVAIALCVVAKSVKFEVCGELKVKMSFTPNKFLASCTSSIRARSVPVTDATEYRIFERFVGVSLHSLPKPLRKAVITDTSGTSRFTTGLV